MKLLCGIGLRLASGEDGPWFAKTEVRPGLTAPAPIVRTSVRYNFVMDASLTLPLATLARRTGG